MSYSTRFASAVHILALLAQERKTPHTSGAIAGSLTTNPSVVRRLLGDLSRAGLTRTQLGKGGGAMLARAPKKISMLDVFLAVEEPTLFAAPRAAPAIDCPVGRAIAPVLREALAPVEAAFRASLAAVSLRDIAKSIKSANSAEKAV